MDDNTADTETPQRNIPDGQSTDEVPTTLPPDAGSPIGPTPQKTVKPAKDAARPTRGHVRPLDPPAPPAPMANRAENIGDRSQMHPMQVPSRPDRGAALLIGSVSGVLGAALVVAALAITGAFDRPETIIREITSPAPPQIVVDGTPSNTAAAVALKVVPSIVTIEVGSTNGDASFAAFGSGSGVVLTAGGFIVTNHHVIADADRTQVVLQSGVIYPATVIGSDPITDLAVLQIDGPPLTPIELGSSDALRIGDQAVAIGNPLGLPGGASVTVGVVSAFDREVSVGSDPTDRLFGMLQTDAPITRGSSGGALVDSQGRLIGITTAIGITDAGAEGVGFAIPVELVTRITDEIIEQGFVEHTFLGVLLQDHFEQRDGARVPEGAAIIDFLEPSGARDAGLEVGDRLVTINGKIVRTKEDIINELRKFRVGDTISFDVVRDGSTFSTEVILGERPDEV